jgi:hypothetical protein
MAKKQWTEQEKSILSSNISDGMLVSDMCKLIPRHPESGIVRVAQTFNFGVKTKKGIKKFYVNKSTRNRQKKTAMQTIVGEPRTAPTVQEPTTLEKLPKLSDASIPQNIDGDSLTAIYDEISTLMKSKNFTSVEISAVTSEGLKVTLSKEST